MAKKKRPSLKNYLATGQVMTEEAEREQSPEPAEETPVLPASLEKDDPGQGIEAEALPEKKSPQKVRRRKAPEKKASKDSPGIPPETGLVESGPVSQASSPDERSGGEGRTLLDMLCEEDKKTWEKILAEADVEFLPLEFIERREDFRTMDRSRFTLFRLDREGEPLFHVRTSVQIREPLVALLKWDETGRVSVYRP
jgi:hypothetical protein